MNDSLRGSLVEDENISSTEAALEDELNRLKVQLSARKESSEVSLPVDIPDDKSANTDLASQTIPNLQIDETSSSVSSRGSSDSRQSRSESPKKETRRHLGPSSLAEKSNAFLIISFYNDPFSSNG
jgi:hypothetical protein